MGVNHIAEIQRFAQLIRGWKKPTDEEDDEEESWFLTLTTPTNYYPGCLPCLRAIAQNLCTLGGDATPDEEADQGGVNCHGAYANSACDYCDADNPIGRLPRDCIEPAEGSKYWWIGRAIRYTQVILEDYSDMTDQEDYDEEYNAMQTWRDLLVDYVIEHKEELIE